MVSFDDGDEDWGEIDVTCLPHRDWDAIPGAWRFAATLQRLQSRRDIASAKLDEPDIVMGIEHLFLRSHAKRFPRTPWLYVAHSLVIAHEIYSYGLTGLQHRLTRHFYIKQQMWALRNSSTIVRFNQSVTNALQQFYGAKAIQAPILINPTGIDAPDTIISDSPLKTDGPLRLLFVGRLVLDPA